MTATRQPQGHVARGAQGTASPGRGLGPGRPVLQVGARRGQRQAGRHAEAPPQRRAGGPFHAWGPRVSRHSPSCIAAPPPRAPRKHGPSTQEGVQVCTGAGPPRRPPWSFQPKIPISFSFPLFLWTQKKWIHHINTCHLGRCGRHGPNPFLPPQGKFQSRTSLSPASEQGVSGVIRRHPGQRAGQAMTQSASAGTPGARRPP